MSYTRFSYNKEKTTDVRNEIASWITSLNANYVLTIQFPVEKRSTNYERSKNMLRSVMANLEFYLLGNDWIHHHIPFVAFCEKGKFQTYHYHVFLYNNDIKLNRMKTAMHKVFHKTGFDTGILYLDPFFTANTPNYCTKEIYADKNKHFDTNNIIISQELFGI